MAARIYQPARNAMQSGNARSREWILEYAPSSRSSLDPLMGWTSSGDTQSQVRLSFKSQEEAESYAKEHGIEYVVSLPKKRKAVVRPRGYAENFAVDRRKAWTH
ncbi:MAG: ETC complex I subunit [Albidovulum sp.]|nr:ETC complex I subunit [Albidovulum sp.]